MSGTLSICWAAHVAVATLIQVAPGGEPGRPDSIVLKRTPGPIWGVAFSPDGRLLAAAGSAHQQRQAHLTIWDLEDLTSDGYELGAGHTATSVSFAPDGKTLAVAVTDGRILFWDIAQRKERSVVYQRMVKQVRFSPDGKLLAAGGGAWQRPGELILWDVGESRVVRRLRGHEDSISSVAFSPDDRMVASASSLDDSVRVWDVETGHQKHVFRLRAWSVAFSPDGTTLAGGGSTTVFWDPVSGDELARHGGGWRAVPSSLAFSPDGKVLAGCGTGFDAKPGELWLVDLSGAKATSRLLESGNREFREVAISPDGRRMAVATSATVELWNLAELRALEQP